MLIVAVRIPGNPEDPRERLQNTFLQTYKHIDRFEDRSSVWTWRHRIIVNSALSKLRSRRRRPDGSLDDVRERIVAQMHEPSYQDRACAP